MTPAFSASEQTDATLLLAAHHTHGSEASMHDAQVKRSMQDDVVADVAVVTVVKVASVDIVVDSVCKNE